MITLRSIPRRLSLDVVLAADPAARRASAKLLQSFTHKASVAWRWFRIQQSHTGPAQFTVHHSEQVSLFQTNEKAAHSSPKRTSQNSSYLARVPRQHSHSRALTVQDVRMRRHDHMNTSRSIHQGSSPSSVRGREPDKR